MTETQTGVESTKQRRTTDESAPQGRDGEEHTGSQTLNIQCATFAWMQQNSLLLLSVDWADSCPPRPLLIFMRCQISYEKMGDILSPAKIK